MNNNYIKKQAKHVAEAQTEAIKSDALWRILSYSDEPNLSHDSTLTPSQWEKAQNIVGKVLADD